MKLKMICGEVISIADGNGEFGRKLEKSYSRFRVFVLLIFSRIVDQL